MTDRLRIAVIVTHDRPRDFIECLAAIEPQMDHVVVVDHGAVYAREAALRYMPGRYSVEYWDEELPNLSAMWNLGLDAAREYARQERKSYDVAVLNDDAMLPRGWMELVTVAMQVKDVAAGCVVPMSGGQFGPLVHRQAGPVPLHLRMTGHAFALAGEAQLRADPTLRWWYGDDDLDWQARELAGTVVVPGTPVLNLRANSTTVGVLAEQAGLDRKTFEAKWGKAPW